jgi:hypothetical protein
LHDHLSFLDCLNGFLVALQRILDVTHDVLDVSHSTLEVSDSLKHQFHRCRESFALALFPDMRIRNVCSGAAAGVMSGLVEGDLDAWTRAGGFLAAIAFRRFHFLRHLS